MQIRRRHALAVALFGTVWTGVAFVGCADTRAVPDATRQILAPTGKLRVGLYQGASSFMPGSSPGSDRGVSYELGKAFAAWLGVPFEPVVFAKNADMLAVMKSGRLDITFTNASAERATYMDFTPTYMDVEKSFLVVSSSPLRTIDDLKKPGLRVGVSEGSSTEGELLPLFPGATMVRVPTLNLAADMLTASRIDAFATNKALLFEMSDGLPGSRVLPGTWGMEHFAAGIPKGRDAALPTVSRFVREALVEGTVARAVAHAGLRGTVAPSQP